MSKKLLLIPLVSSCGFTSIAHGETIDSLFQQCAGQTPAHLSHAIVKTESSYNPNAIGINKNGKSTFTKGLKRPTNYNEAVQLANYLIANGNNIDLGLGQINSSNLKRLGVTVEQVLEPCNNLKVMQYIFSSCYNAAGNVGLGERIQRAFSCYNTGNNRKGFNNGYVNKITKNMNDYLARNGNTTYNQNIGLVGTNVKLPRSSVALANYANKINAVGNQTEYNQKDNTVGAEVAANNVGVATRDKTFVDVFGSENKRDIFVF